MVAEVLIEQLAIFSIKFAPIVGVDEYPLRNDVLTQELQGSRRAAMKSNEEDATATAAEGTQRQRLHLHQQWVARSDMMQQETFVTKRHVD